MEAQETVREDPAVKKRTKFTLDESRDDAILRTCVSEPRLQVVLEHPVKSSRLGATWGVFRSRSGSAGVSFSHDAIVLSDSFQVQAYRSIGFPESNSPHFPTQTC